MSKNSVIFDIFITLRDVSKICTTTSSAQSRPQFFNSTQDLISALRHAPWVRVCVFLIFKSLKGHTKRTFCYLVFQNF